MERVDCVVIGAGVVGLAIARALALAGREVLILEAAGAFGTETSARNSEVVHAGIYYPKDSLKARFCVPGRRMLYAYCQGRGITHRRCGKLIVAADASQEEALLAIRAKAEANGVDDLRWMKGIEARGMEPNLKCSAALFSPSTGIIDSHGLMLSYLGEAEAEGASLAVHAPVVSGACTTDGIRLEIGGPDAMTLLCKTVVNSAGFSAPSVSRSITGIPGETIPKGWLCKGNYFTLTGRTPFTHLVYPVPEAAGLGVHLTLDLGGQARFGPDVEWIDAVDYSVEAKRGDAFYAAIRGYWPGLPDGVLQPGYAGIRPKINAPDQPAADFLIQGPRDHGVAGFVALYGIESPGLTASLALAEAVSAKLIGS